MQNKSIKKQLLYNVRNDCHEFYGFINNRGYGRFSFLGKVHLAHRAAYEFYKGPIGEGKMVLHKCNNRKCINPDHLYEGTAIQNSQDRYRVVDEKRLIKGLAPRKVFCLTARIDPILHREILEKCYANKLSLQEYLVGLIEKDIRPENGII